MRKYFKVILIITLIFSNLIFITACEHGNSVYQEKDYKYVGSSQAEKYHNPSCEWAKKISSKNLVYFEDASDARSQGYDPCTACNPQN